MHYKTTSWEHQIKKGYNDKVYNISESYKWEFSYHKRSQIKLWYTSRCHSANDKIIHLGLHSLIVKYKIEGKHM